MDRASLRRIFADVGAEVLFEESMAHHTTWRIGGPADVFVEPANPEQVREVLRRAVVHGIPWFIIGRGSNVLVKDGGIRGLVVKLGDAFADCRVQDTRLTAQAGRTMVSAAHVAIRHGLSGLEFATGIPGTVGGAVAMNAGAHGGEVKDVLIQAEVITPDGEIQVMLPHDLEFRYRHAAVQERRWVVLSAVFQLAPGDMAEMQERTRKWAKRRQATQPLSQPNCGSVFRNPEGDFSARLIEACGLKSAHVGDAQVSERHANFIVNLDQARAADVLALIELVQGRVREQFGIELLPEVRVVGEDEARR